MWVEYQYTQSLLDPLEIVEDCEGMFEDTYGSVIKQDRDGLVLSDLQQDLVRMSNQPAIRYEYRRYVIIKSNADVHERPGEQEWVSGRSEFHARVINFLAVSSASGSWFLISGLATKSVARTNHGIYKRYIICTMAPGGCPLESRFSQILGEWSRGRVTLAIRFRAISPVVLNNGLTLS